MSLEVDIAHAQGAFRLQASFRSEGRLTALFGQSGSGKTTLVNAIAGLIQPQRGRIVVDGAVLLDTEAGVFVPKHRRRIGYMFQEGRLFPHLTVRQNLLFGRWFTRRGNGAATELDAVVDLLGISHLLARRPGRLSGGEKQRVAIGRALLAQPRLLLMDEPLASLDDIRKAEILPYIERLRDEAGVPIVYVSHAVSEVARLATTVVVLEDGMVTAVGATSDILGGRPGLPPLVASREGGAVIVGRIAAHDPGFALSIIDSPAGTLTMPRLDRPVGTVVRILVQARDVMLCVQRPVGISALNVLPGIVAEIGAGSGPWVEARLRCGEAHLLARLTRRSVEDLALAPGCSIFAVFKSVSLDERTGLATPHEPAAARSARSP